MDQQQWLYYADTSDSDNELDEVFVSHKNAELRPDCEKRLVVTSTTDRTVSTPGALTHCNLCLKKNLPYVLEICARKETSESQPYIYVGDGFNVGVPIADRVFFTSECWETKTYRFILEKDAELRVGVLLSHADVGHSYTLKSLFLRVAWDPAVGTNTILGDDVLKVSSNKYTDIRKNTIYGQDSMHCLNEGDKNTAVGYEVLTNLHCGENNTALGAGALKHTEHCDNNTALGVNTLSACGLSGDNNVAVGYEALTTLTTGGNNVAVGNSALKLATTGGNNVAVGYEALTTLTTGGNNVAVGNSALKTTTTSSNNVAVGYEALTTLTTGGNNVAVGNSALKTTTTSSNNVAVGYEALTTLTTGDNNVAVGNSALKSSTTGSQNVAVGYEALKLATTGGNNVAVGTSSLNVLTTGGNNIAVGVEALKIATTSSNNVAVGAYSLTKATTGSQNIAIGSSALFNVATGNYNVAVGHSALDSITTGLYNTAIGALAGTNHNFTNTTCIGYNTQVGANNQIKLGDADTTVVGSNFQVSSDMRDKTEVRNTELGLNFIKQLRPVDYKYDFRETYRTPKPTLPGTTATEEEVKKYQEDLATWTEANKMSNIVPNGTNKRNRYHHGFIAQEVGALNVFGGYQDMLVTGGEDIKTLGYMEFVAPLTKAVQELAAENDALKIRLSNLETNMQVVLSKLT